MEYDALADRTGWISALVALNSYEADSTLRRLWHLIMRLAHQRKLNRQLYNGSDRLTVEDCEFTCFFTYICIGANSSRCGGYDSTC